MKCDKCNHHLNSFPLCEELSHWKTYALTITEKLELKDDERDKLDVAEWLSNYKKTQSYNCTGCGRDYILPTHLIHFTCVCGHGCRLRFIGGYDPDQSVIDAAMMYFGNERQAHLAYIAEIIAGKYCASYSVDKIRESIQNELDRWEMTDKGWKRKVIG